ncbi:hypothetical protein NQZ68_037819 [Dissostichus eleginoides]|nr:hypothetical protein NQZ68_037819 [Dissostichus eleginoides]
MVEEADRKRYGREEDLALRQRLWNLVCSDYWKIPLQHICFMTGWILGYILLGTLCDWLGRRRCFLLSISLSSLLGVVVCLSSSAVVFLMLRLSQGIMLAGVFVSSYIAIRLPAALFSNKPLHRTGKKQPQLPQTPVLLLVAVPLCGEAIDPRVHHGFVSDEMSFTARGREEVERESELWGGRSCVSVFPESPRWLMATAQIPQLKRSLREFSTRNGVCLRDEIYPGETLLSEIDIAFGEDCQPRYFSILELRQTRVIWKNCLILSFTLFIGTGVQYCFTRNLHSYSSNFYFSYFLRVMTGALACVFICLSVNHFGRRGMLLLSAIITGLSSLLLLALTQYLRGGLVLVLSVVGLLFSQALAMLSVLFACEVMPTVVRGGCLGLVLAAGCVGMAASSLMELQNNGGYFLHHVIFASFAVLSVLSIMLLPESKRKPLPDSLKEGESQRRPPLLLPRPDRDDLPLLSTRPPLSEYNPDNYSRLVSATRKMLTKESLPYRIAVPMHAPLLSDSETQRQENGTLKEVMS